MVAAVLLDSEARSSTLDAEPTHGMLREPLLKAYHLLRSLEWGTSKGHLLEASTLFESIGQYHFHSPTVFNFCAEPLPPEPALQNVWWAESVCSLLRR
jgi:hypothetical protein